MRYCGYCGAELPEYARFCRICGTNSDGEVRNTIDVINPSPLHVPSPETPLPLFNVSGLPPSNVEDADETIKNTLLAEEAFDLQTWSYRERESDDYRTLGPEVIAPLAAGFGQMPASNVPVVPGTPHIGGVPAVGERRTWARQQIHIRSATRPPRRNWPTRLQVPRPSIAGHGNTSHLPHISKRHISNISRSITRSIRGRQNITNRHTKHAGGVDAAIQNTSIDKRTARTPLTFLTSIIQPQRRPRKRQRALL